MTAGDCRAAAIGLPVSRARLPAMPNAATGIIESEFTELP